MRVPGPLPLRAAAPCVLDERVWDHSTVVLDNEVDGGRPARHVIDDAPWLWVKLPGVLERLGERCARACTVPAVLARNCLAVPAADAMCE